MAGLLVDDGLILLCHRRHDRTWYPDVWDLPGGHVGTEESPAQALVRELHEELGVRVDPPVHPPLAILRAEALELHIFGIDGWRGEPRNAAPDEHDQIGWFSASDLPGLELAHSALLQVIARAMD